MDAKNQTKKREAAMIELKRMSEADLEAFAGAENFVNGNFPLCGEFTVDSWDLFVIFAGNGADVINVDGERSWKVADHHEVEFLTYVSSRMSWAEFSALVEAGILVEI